MAPQKIIESTKCNRCISAGGVDCATCKPDIQTPAPKLKRCEGADHFGYGHQITIGKNKDGEGLWHSHGKYYHNPDTYWSGRWGDRTPEELLFECESMLEDLHTYHPELFKMRTFP